MNVARRGLAAALLLALSTTAHAAAPLRDPSAGPLEVFAQAHGPAQPGSFVGAGIGLTNHAADAAIDVVITHVLVRWSDGSTMRLDLGEHRMHFEPGSGFVAPMMLVVPTDAPLGLASLEIRAHVAKVTPVAGAPGALGHRGFAGDGQAFDVAGFVVQP